MIPDPWVFALLALAAFRLWHLVAKDKITEPWRDALYERLERTRSSASADYWEAFVDCPWCAGFWACGITYVGWILTLGTEPPTVGNVAVGLGVWFALSGVVALVAVAAERLPSSG